MQRITHEEWQKIAGEFSKAAPSSPQWFALTDAIITYLLQDRIAATKPEPNPVTTLTNGQ